MTNSIDPTSLGSAATDSRALSRSPAAPADEPRRSEPAPVETATTAQPAVAAQPAARSLHPRFKVDPDTQEVTVFMVDLTARRVVRTIPADEIKNLAQGELLELIA